MDVRAVHPSFYLVALCSVALFWDLQERGGLRKATKCHVARD
jgi:hypothetical protein